jgi:predicted cupin superfamily sugar epimerase
MTRIEEIITFYGLIPHPEGGYFQETYRSPESISTPSGERSVSTAIFYLLTKGQSSRLHRIKSDEMWHFYEGDPLIVFEKEDNGLIKETVLGKDLSKNQKFQYVVPANRWFGAYLPEGSNYALVGCTVSPGFDFSDFELAE